MKEPLQRTWLSCSHLGFCEKVVPWQPFWRICFKTMKTCFIYLLEVIMPSDWQSLASHYCSLNFSSALLPYLPEHICPFPSALRLWLLWGTAVSENGVQTVISLLHLHTANTHMSWLTCLILPPLLNLFSSFHTSHLPTNKPDFVLRLQLRSC